MSFLWFHWTPDGLIWPARVAGVDLCTIVDVALNALLLANMFDVHLPQQFGDTD